MFNPLSRSWVVRESRFFTISYCSCQIILNWLRDPFAPRKLPENCAELLHELDYYGLKVGSWTLMPHSLVPNVLCREAVVVGALGKSILHLSRVKMRSAIC